ncbi:fms-related tyrosine kinase 3 ligand isoform X3 [Engystomops pustulosus]|uniref:fms-related tyrosine kinase 3 ligand isoform X3 n=1 Tax=Engystomops pustulosus TaxID=76066 RepID=UPI003AFABDFD
MQTLMRGEGRDFRTSRSWGTREFTASILTRASFFSNEEMISCHELRGKVIAFFLLLNFLELSFTCTFDNDPISGDYVKKISALEEITATDYQVTRQRIIPEEKEDQNCFQLLTLVSSNTSLANIQRKQESVLDKSIISLLNEIHFLGECLFKIPPNCPMENVNISTVLHNLKNSLATLKPNIENNFTHCLRVKCESAGEHGSKIRSTTITLRRHNKESLSDHFGGDLVNESNGTRTHFPLLLSIVFLIVLLFIVCNLRINRT